MKSHQHNVNYHQVHDPVCGMLIDPAFAAVTLEHEGSFYYFCSRHCADRFNAVPLTFIQSPHHNLTGEISSSVHSHEHAEFHHPVQSAPIAGTNDYTYPMHPEIHRSVSNEK